MAQRFKSQASRELHEARRELGRLNMQPTLSKVGEKWKARILDRIAILEQEAQQ